MSIIHGPEFGITRMPPGESPSAYPDMELEKLIGAIETEGARIAWSRASECPCAPVDSQLRQPDPNCLVCEGKGLVYFGPRNYEPPVSAGTLTSLQKAILADSGAAVIRGVIARPMAKMGGSMTASQDAYDVMGRWLRGLLAVTVRPENKIGFYDRIVMLDSEMCYTESLDVAAGSTTLPLRYRASTVNYLRSLSTVFVEDQHYEVVDGIVTWVSSSIPASALRIAVHYLMHPTYLIINHPHVIREVGRRRRAKTVVSIQGTPTPLPIMAHVMLEFLPFPESV